MFVQSLLQGAPDVAEPHETAWQAALRMRQRAVGSLVVVNDYSVPIGIITDRDLVERVMAAGKDPAVTKLADVMTPEPVTIRADQDISTALELMRKGGFRRLPVVTDAGSVFGLVALDDILVAWARQCEDMRQVLQAEMPAGIAEANVSRWE